MEWSDNPAPEDQFPVKFKPQGNPVRVTMNYSPDSPPLPPVPDVWLRIPWRALTVGQEFTISLEGDDEVWTLVVAEIQADDQGLLYRILVKELQTPPA